MVSIGVCPRQISATSGHGKSPMQLTSRRSSMSLRRDSEGERGFPWLLELRLDRHSVLVDWAGSEGIVTVSVGPLAKSQLDGNHQSF